MQKRKLIEVALPLEAINRESAREKSIRHGHPSTLHLWWARRPLAAARAVIFAQLVDDPSSHPEEFPTDELQRKERERLHGIIERLVVWENIRDERLLDEAHAEILKSTGGNPPAILDPFAGGGTIPLEAQRLRLQAHASDLNPVAVLINKALIEIPPRFRDAKPVFPGLAGSEIRTWNGAEGLAADVREYGSWMREQAEKRIGHLYPRADGKDVIAWVWARTVTCPNPACGIEMPLAKSWWLSKRPGREAWVVPTIVLDSSAPSGKRVSFAVARAPLNQPTAKADGTMMRNDALCVSCESTVSKEYIKSWAVENGFGSILMAVVAEDNRKRVFLAPTEEHVSAADVEAPDDAPDAVLSTNSQYMGPPLYGMTTFRDLFTARQLVALTTFSDLVVDARAKVVEDGGTGEYADAVATYLGMGVSRMADIANALCRWENTKEQVRNLFGRQAISMLWDYAETRPFGRAAGAFEVSLGNLVKAIYDTGGPLGRVEQADASSRSYAGVLISTDPPYYDNVPYADLADFFYVWLRRSLRYVQPDLLATMLVPKREELVANPHRQGGRGAAQEFFEDGFRRVFAHARETAMADFPIAVWYAFKQSDTDAEGQASTGWETLLEGMISSGWEITSTWPNRSELGNRMRSQGSNALASSIVLTLRPRAADEPTTDRRGFIAALEAELPGALRKLQQGQIAPVDLPQAAIGPGMAVFSRYSAVLEPDGKRMTVRSALARINEILDQVLNEQEGDFDAPSRFAIAWYRQHGYGSGSFGDANNLANARNTTVDVMDRDGVLTSRAGKVQLIKPADLSWDYDPIRDTHTSNWEALHHLIKVLERDGIAPAGDFLQAALSRPDGAVDADLVKELAHLLFRVAESNGWTKDALSFNSLVTSWPEILDVARTAKKPAQTQGAFDFDEDD